MNKPNVLFVGGDERQLYCAKKLFEEGFEVSGYGFDKAVYIPEFLMNYSNLKIALILADAVVLPTPFKLNGQLNAPLTDETIDIKFVIKNIDKDKTVFLGNADEEVKAALKNKNVNFFDFSQDEELNILNADITAEAAVSVLMNTLKSTLSHQKILITGYGRITKNLVKFLLPFRAEVTVAARKKADLAWAKLYGCQSKAFKNLNDIGSYDIIINTVPATALNKADVAVLKDETLFLDLAPQNAYHPKNYIKANALPGKYAPLNAGNNLAEFIKEKFEVPEND